MSDYEFTLVHPQSVEIYKPIGGAVPKDEVVYLYFRLENTSAKGAPFTFAHWDSDEHRWISRTRRLVPILEVTSTNAPIRGQPEVRLGALSDRTICPGRYFPPNLPVVDDFPLNEANYDRGFCVALRPDRSNLVAQGALNVRFTLAFISGWSNIPAVPDPRAPMAEFRIPVKFVDRFRPESPTAEPGSRSQ